MLTSSGLALKTVYLLASVATLAVLPPGARGQQCACGYKDPETLALFTDSIITYFNETDAAEQVVFTPEQSADRYGRDDAGYAGTGQQPWINSQRINDWEDDFSATWRSAVMYNNTFLQNHAMVMRVQPAEQKHRLVFGSQFQTRRRDILYGTFRTMVRPPSLTSAGTEFDIELAYNESSLIQTALFSKDNASDAILSLGWSSHKNNLKPVIINQTNISPDQPNHAWHEYRMDWLPTVMSWTNDGSNSTLTALARSNATGHDVQVPSIPAPFSYKHWSNGSPTGSRGPPQSQSPLAEIRYARLFFNSSITSRTLEFEQHCSAAGGEQVCSTEDWTLRNSTQFDLIMTEKQQMPKRHYHLRPYSWIGFTISIGIFTILFAHALISRTVRTHIKRKAFYAEYDQETAPADTTVKVSEGIETEDQSVLAEMTDRKGFDEAMATWDNPDLLPRDDETDYENDFAMEKEDMIDDPFWHTDEQASARSLGGSMHGYRAPSVQVQPGSVSIGTPYSPSISSTTNLAARIRSGISTPSRPGSVQFSPSSSVRMMPVPPSPMWVERGITPPQSQYDGGSTDEPSVISGEDGLGAPPALPELVVFHPNPVMMLEDGRQMAINWSTPVVEWNPAQSGEQTKAQGQLAQRNMSAKPDSKPAAAASDEAQAKVTLWERIKYKVFVRKEEVGATASGASRVEYLDGLRGFACLLVSVHHWCMIFYYGFTTPGVPIHYMFEHWIRRILGPVIANGGLNVGIFFVLAARVIANRYLVRGNLQDMAQQLFTRVPRLATTITAALFINYFLIEADTFYWVARLPSRTFSVWSYYQDFSSAGEFINDYLALWWMQPPMITPLTRHYATGILWTVPVIIQSSWTVYLCALIAREIKNHKKRYAFYLTCFTIEWWSNRYDYFFIGGLIIADLDNRLKYRQLSAKGFKVFGKFRMTYEPFAWLLFCLGMTITYLTQQRRFNARNNEYNIHANFKTGSPNVWAGEKRPYDAPAFQDCIWVMSFFLLCDLSSFMRTVFTLRVWTVFGRNAFSLYLLHGTVFWTVGAVATLKMLRAGIPYWGAQLLNFPLCYAILFVAVELFTRTFDRWGIMVARAFWRGASGGLGRRIR